MGAGARPRSGQAGSMTASGVPLRRRKFWKSAAHRAYHTTCRWWSSTGVSAATAVCRSAIAQATSTAASASAAAWWAPSSTTPYSAQTASRFRLPRRYRSTARSMV
ncbi:hypothetical protein A4V12_09025 [Streptomyces noursei]|nr:hypothetical protein A4V12_09025 [Streptomyces noursei]